MHSHWLYITSFLDLFATSLLVPFLAIHLRMVGLSRLLVGVFTSVYPSVQLFSSPAAGYWSDRCGRKQALLLSLLLCSLTYYVLSSTTSLAVIFCCRLVLGMLKHTQTLCKAIFAEVSRSDKTLSAEFGALNAAEALGYTLGPVVGAHFIDNNSGFQLLCKTTATLFIINSFVVCYFLSEEMNNNTIKRNIVKHDSKVTSVGDSAKTIDWNVFWDIFIMKWFLCISLSLFYTNYTFTIVEQFEVSPAMIGYTNSFQGLLSVITGIMYNKMTNVFSCSESQYVKLKCWFLILSLSLLCSGLATNIVMFLISLVPVSVSSTLLRIYTTEMLILRTSLQNRGSVVGVENTIASTAFLVSPFIFEICTNRFGAFSVPFMSCFFTAMGASLSMVLMLVNKVQCSKTTLVS